MEKNTKKRMPKIVYTAEEEDWLVSNALEYSSIIENKKTDDATNRDKDNAWEKIATAFNFAPPGQERALKSLREKYAKIKQTLKDRAFYFLKDAKKTGGGPPKKELPALSEPMQQLAVLLTPSTLGLAAISGDSDHLSANESALQYARREIASSFEQMQVISVAEILVDDGDRAFRSEDEDVDATFVEEAHGNVLTTVELESTKHHNTESMLPNPNECTVVDRTWERVNPAKLRKPLNALLHSRRHKRESEGIPAPSRTQELAEEKQQHSAKKYKIEIEILEGERERYKFERERAALDLKRAAIECERAELDRERSAIELQRAKNQLSDDKEFQRLRLFALQQPSGNMPHSVTPVPTPAAKKGYD